LPHNKLQAEADKNSSKSRSLLQIHDGLAFSELRIDQEYNYYKGMIKWWDGGHTKERIEKFGKFEKYDEAIWAIQNDP
jgi:hypothetical protein